MKKILQNISVKRKSQLWQYYFFNFLKDFGFFSAVLVPFYTEWGHISLMQVQLLQSWFMLCLFLFDIPTGVIADHIGKKYALALGALIDAIGAFVYGSSPHFTIFIVGEFLMALGISFISGADDALLYDVLKENKLEKDSAKIFGHAHAVNLLGMLLSAIIGSFIAGKFGLNAPMQASAIPLIIAFGIALVMKKPATKKRKNESKNYFMIARRGLIFLRKQRTLRKLALDGLIVYSAAYFVIWFYQPVLERIHISILYFGFFQALLIISEMLIAGNFGLLEKIFGSGKAFLRFSASATAFGFLVVAIYPGIISVLLLLILSGGFGLTRIELMTAYMNKFIPSGQRATVLSSISTFRRIALVMINPLIGFTADHSLQIALFIIGLLPLTLFLFSPIEQEMLE